MKRLLLKLLTIGVALMTVSCYYCHYDYTPQEKSYLYYLMEDYDAIVALYPDAKDNFVEARYVLKDVISETDPDDIKAESVQVICYYWAEGYSNIFILDHNFETGEKEIEHYMADSPWTGDKKIPEKDMQAFSLSLTDAIKKAVADPQAKESDGLDTRFVTLRMPLWPVWPHPQYVVGGNVGRKFHVFVDANTGAVKTLENQVEDGAALAYLKEDYSLMLDNFWAEEVMGYKIDLHDCFTEAQYILNAPMNSRQASELYPKEVTYLFYVPEASKDGKDVMAKGWRDISAGDKGVLEYSMDELSSPWTIDKWITVDDIDYLISLDDAIYNVKISNVTDPDTAFVTLRWPVSPAFGHPQFVFIGENTKTVYVDAFTGEISAVE